MPLHPGHDRLAADRGRLYHRRALAELPRHGNPASGRLVIIEGPAGIGKTHLLRIWMQLRRQHGATVLHVRCSARESGYPWGVARRLLGPAVLARPGLLDDPDLAVRRAARFIGLPLDAGTGPDLLDECVDDLHQLTVRLAEQDGITLVIDDAHACDVASLRWLNHLLVRLEQLRTTIVLAMRRSQEPTDADLIDAIRDAGEGHVIRLWPLSASETAEEVRSALGTETEAEVVTGYHYACGGNPLLLDRLLNSVTSDGSSTDPDLSGTVVKIGALAQHDMVLHRMAVSSDESRALVDAVAILDQDATLMLCASMADLSIRTAATLAARLRDEGLLVCDTEPLTARTRLSFTHPMIRQAMVGAAGTSAGHSRAAQILLGAGAGAERVAAHLVNVKPIDDPEFIAVLRDGARQATARGAAAVAVSYLRRAIAEPLPDDVRTTILIELSRAELLVAPAAAARHLEQATAREGEAIRGLATPDQASALWLANRSAEAVRMLQETLDELLSRERRGPGYDADDRIMLQSRLIQVAYEHSPTVRLAAAHASDVAEAAGQDNPAGWAAAAAMAVHGMAGNLDARQTLEYADRAMLALDQRMSHLALRACLAYVMADEIDASACVSGQIIQQGQVQGSTFLWAIGQVMRAGEHLFAGAAADSVTATRYALNVVEEEHRPLALNARSLQTMALIMQGRIVEAEAGLIAQDPPLTDAAWEWPLHLFARAQLLTARGDPHGALAALRACGRHLQRTGITNPALTSWRSEAAFVLAGLGELGEARALAEEELAAARFWGTPRTVGNALCALGMTIGGPEGEDVLREAVDLLDYSSSPPLLIRAWIVLATTAHRNGRTAIAREAVQKAGACLNRCQAPALATQVDAVRQLVGLPRLETAADRLTLTANEQKVARLAAAGASNREIAESLFVTLRTVEFHLSNVYRKLGISGRSALRTALTPDDRPSDGAPGTG
ncbi:MAG TPA: LuxR C-terminal-related transcriptional regulator [Actinoplanes sp.]|jgi:DNA-binding CsgD family transcriptional regulator